MCTDVPIKGEEGVFVLMCLSKERRGLFVLRRLCVLMCLSKGRRGVRTDVTIKGEEGVVRTDVPIKGEEGLCVLMCLSKGGGGCSY